MYGKNREINKKIVETQIRTVYHMDKLKAPLPPDYTSISSVSIRSFLLYSFSHADNEATSAAHTTCPPRHRPRVHPVSKLENSAKTSRPKGFEPGT
jgi:hypothetical protein